MASWCHTDFETDALYVNLNAKNSHILKIKDKQVMEIANGLNTDNVLLRSSVTISPFTYVPDVNISEGFKLIRELIFDNLACEREQRYMIICWMISAFLIDFVNSQAIMKFSGSSAAGKTTAAKLVSYLLYGNNQVGAPSAAAAFADAAQTPMLFLDNLEAQDINNQMRQFLLLSASRASKKKRTSGTESGVTQEEPKSLVLSTAIEPFQLPELINRTIEIDFSVKYKNLDFLEDEVARAIVKNRDIILSSILKLIAVQIIPKLSNRKNLITVLKQQFKGHAKERNNEYIALLMHILTLIMPHIPFYSPQDLMFGVESGDADIWYRWIEYQNSKARETETGSNSIIKMLDGIVQDYLYKMVESKVEPDYLHNYDEKVYQYQHPDYLLIMIKTLPVVKNSQEDGCYQESYIEFVATASEIVYAFDTYCRNKGIKNSYSSASVFGRRIENDIPTLKKSNWNVESKENIHPYYKIVRGKRFYKLIQTFISVE